MFTTVPTEAQSNNQPASSGLKLTHP